MSRQLLDRLKKLFSCYSKALRWLLAIACLAYVVYFFTQNVDKLKELFSIKLAYLPPIVALLALNMLIVAYRFRIILQNCSTEPVPFWSWFKIMVLGRFLNSFAPQAGNVFRGVVLKNKYNIAYTHYISAVFSFIWLDFAVNIIYAMLIIVAVQPRLQIKGLNVIALLAVVLTVVITDPFILLYLLSLGSFKNKWCIWLHSKLKQSLSISVANLKNISVLVKFCVSGIVSLACIITLFLTCFVALRKYPSVLQMVLFAIIFKLVNKVIITPGNLGVREIIYGWLAAQVKIGMAAGFAASIIIRIINQLIVIMLGMFFGGKSLLKNREKYKNTDKSLSANLDNKLDSSTRDEP